MLPLPLRAKGRGYFKNLGVIKSSLKPEEAIELHLIHLLAFRQEEHANSPSQIRGKRTGMSLSGQESNAFCKFFYEQL